MMEIAEKVLDLVKKKEPSAEASVRVTTGRRAGTRFAANEITTAVDSDLGGVTVTVAIGKRHANASTTRMDALDALVDRAVQMAKLAPEDPELMPMIGAQTFKPSPAAYDEDTSKLPHDLRASAARASIEACEQKSVIGAGFHFGHAEHELYATSAGFRGEHSSTNVSYTMTARTPDGTGSGWASGDETRARDLDSKSIASRAIDKAAASRKPKALAPGKYTVVLEPDAVGDLLSFLIESLGARQADEGRSFFTKNKVGGKHFGSVTLKSDPTDPSMPSRPYDDDGIVLEPTTWIENGTLKALHYSRFWAAKQNKKPTGSHGVYHLLGGQAEDTQALIKKVEKGLLVTRFWYTRWLDPRTLQVTGLTRDGVFLIEKGAVTIPVNNFRFNESPVKMLSACTDLTKVARRVPSWGFDVLRVPAILTHDFEMASVSAAV